MACKTCGESKITVFPEGFAYCGALWKCPTCGCCFARPSMPEEVKSWAIVPTEQGWRPEAEVQAEYAEKRRIQDTRNQRANFAKFEQRIAHLR